MGLFLGTGVVSVASNALIVHVFIGLSMFFFSLRWVGDQGENKLFLVCILSSQFLIM